MASTEHVFLSGSMGWGQIGGLFGYLLTVGGALEASRDQLRLQNAERAEKGLKPIQQTLQDSIGVHGGENLCHSLAACRAVILRQPLSMEAFEQRTDRRTETPENLEPDWEDDALRVWKVPIRRARSSSPQKRRRISDSMEDEDPFKDKGRPSDPEFAKTIVEKIMFNGQLNGWGLLTSKPLSSVKSTDTAFVSENDVLSVYNGPYAADGPLSNPNQVAWVVPTKSDKLRQNGLRINHYPLASTTYSRDSLSYIVKCHGRRGKFNPTAAKALGVKPQDFKVLASGQNAQGKDGITVTPDMVLGEPQPGKGFIVADIATRDVLDPFMDRPEWSNPELMADIVAMYWIVGPGLANDAQIQKFVKEHPQMKHIFFAEDISPNVISLVGPAELQTKLRCIDPDRYPLLKYDNTAKGEFIEAPEVELGRAGKKMNLMPRLMFDAKAGAPFPNLLEAAKSVSPEILEMAAKAKAETSDPEFLRQVEEHETDIPSRDTEIIPLGTGSSAPGKYRNVSATLIRVPGIGNYLLDCGEGTLGQIKRLFGEEETRTIIRDLKCIVISHLHADHHLGTPTIVNAWYRETLDDGNATLSISCIKRYRQLLEEVAQVEDFGFHRLRFPHCTDSDDRDVVYGEDLAQNFGLNSIKRIPVTHCWRSHAVQIELTSGLRIAYSGDCRPSEQFARVCEGAHLLIHECTFDDGMERHAKKKNHSTIGDALSVARMMKARRLLLTHFSQRYVKADTLKRDIVDGDEMEVLMALDHMKVRLGDFKAAAAFQPAITKLLDASSD